MRLFWWTVLTLVSGSCASNKWVARAEATWEHPGSQSWWWRCRKYRGGYEGAVHAVARVGTRRAKGDSCFSGQRVPLSGCNSDRSSLRCSSARIRGALPSSLRYTCSRRWMMHCQPVQCSFSLFSSSSHSLALPLLIRAASGRISSSQSCYMTRGHMMMSAQRDCHPVERSLPGMRTTRTTRQLQAGAAPVLLLLLHQQAH